MTALGTDAIVLHAVDYLESSRIIRLLTREAGIQSVLARGARTSRKRFGSALDLFAEGRAELQVQSGRELHTLNSFDVVVSRTAIGANLSRFTAAAAIAEIVLRIVHDESATHLFDLVSATFRRIESASEGDVTSLTLGAMWRMAADVGVAPALDICAACHTLLPPAEDARFSHRAGGALCDRCAPRFPSSRRLPASARITLSMWLRDEAVSLADEPTVRAHQRLFREFLTEHISEVRALPAYAVWESGRWESGTDIAASEL